MTKEEDEERKLLRELGLSEADLAEPASTSRTSMNPLLATGLGVAFLVNVGILLSLPPVLRGKGAPYLPTNQKNMQTLFAQLQKDPDFLRHNQQRRLTFVDLGSGDGRFVFGAARLGLFRRCIGYEINPLLHAFASTRRLVQPKYWDTTSFALRDIWKVDLRDSNVVAVYGLGPIMADLGVKLRNELQPGSYVLSNVFTIPGWRPMSSSNGTYIYKIPCWKDAPPAASD